MDCQAEEHVALNVNGTLRELQIKPSRTLLDVLREDLNLTGAKLACDNGECGSCIVLLGRRPAKACLLAAKRAQGKDVTTIEGLARLSAAHADSGESAWAAYHPLQQALSRERRHPMRVLHSGDDHAGERTPDEEQQPYTRRSREEPVAQHVPLYRLHEDHRCRS